MSLEDKSIVYQQYLELYRRLPEDYEYLEEVEEDIAKAKADLEVGCLQQIMNEGVTGLEIGGERTPAYPDYVQLDSISTWDPDILADARSIPVQDNTYEHLYARNVLEHFSWRETKDVIKEWIRVVKPGGLVEIIVPDTIGIVNDYLSGKNSWEHCCERLAGTQDYASNTHLAFFTYDEFEKLFPEDVDIEIEQTHLGGGITAKVYK